MKEKTEEVKEKINELIEDINYNSKHLISEFLNLLFWKDYSEGHINSGDRLSIFSEIEKATKTGNDYFLDTNKILPFINKLREQIGLTELTTKMGNCLMELTDEVRKELIVKELET